MPVIVAKYAGYCPGVSRAVRTLEDSIRNRRGGESVCTLGQLIHNRHFTQEMADRQVAVVSEDQLDMLAEHASPAHPVTLIVRAHGITKACMEKLETLQAAHPDFRFIDCTCRFVKAIHTIMERDSAPDVLTILLGDPDHPEVIGIRSRAKGPTVVVQTAEELEDRMAEIRDLMENSGIHHILAAAQTTQKLTEWKNCRNYIRNLCTNAEICDTICSVTEMRQNEVDALSRKVDRMLIIGDRQSSNTNKLWRTAKANLDETYLIEDVSDLAKLTPALPHQTVGIAAGASASGSIIEEVNKTMSEEIKEVAENFAELLEESGLKTVKSGETVKGVITSISPNELHVDLGCKVTGIIAFQEITDNPQDKLDELFKVGDEIEARVMKVSDLDGVATLSKKQNDSAANWNKIVDAFNDGTILEGRIAEVVKSGVLISLGGVRVFIPASQSGIPKSGDLNTLVGTTQRVKIIDLNEQRRRAVASIRAVMKDEQKEKEAEFWATIEEGKWYEGTVKSITSYGAFVDLGGVDGMVHSTELSWKRIKHPSEVVSIGDVIKVYVKNFDAEARRISLGYKTEENNPWNVFLNTYSVGDTAKVRIVSLMDFGAFAEVVPGTDGLIHISQIADRKINKPSDVLEVGQEVDAKIINIDTEKRKISLSIRALLEENAAGAEAAEEN